MPPRGAEGQSLSAHTLFDIQWTVAPPSPVHLQERENPKLYGGCNCDLLWWLGFLERLGLLIFSELGGRPQPAPGEVLGM